MQVQQLPSSGAWQVSAMVSNGRDSWLEFSTFYGVPEKEAIARFINAVHSAGWTVIE
jgi:hypothetical protein